MVSQLEISADAAQRLYSLLQIIAAAAKIGQYGQNFAQFGQNFLDVFSAEQAQIKFIPS